MSNPPSTERAETSMAEAKALLDEFTNTIHDWVNGWAGPAKVNEARAKVLALLSSSGAGDAAVETGWRPIESAPKDRTEILLCSETGRRSIETGAYLQNMIHAAKVDGEDCFYVGWMPLPPVIERAVIAQEKKHG